MGEGEGGGRGKSTVCLMRFSKRSCPLDLTPLLLPLLTKSTIHSLQAAHTKLVATTSTQTTQLSTLKAQLSTITAKEKKAREEQEAWVKEERVWEDEKREWEDKEREWKARAEVLEKEVRKGRDRVSQKRSLSISNLNLTN